MSPPRSSQRLRGFAREHILGLVRIKSCWSSHDFYASRYTTRCSTANDHCHLHWQRSRRAKVPPSARRPSIGQPLPLGSAPAMGEVSACFGRIATHKNRPALIQTFFVLFAAVFEDGEHLIHPSDGISRFRDGCHRQYLNTITFPRFGPEPCLFLC